MVRGWERRALVRAGDEDHGLAVADLSAAEVTRVQHTNPIATDRIGDLRRRRGVALPAAPPPVPTQ